MCDGSQLGALEEENRGLRARIAELEKNQRKPRKPKAPPAEDKPLTPKRKLELRFAEKSGIKLPPSSTEQERRSAAVRWWKPLEQMLKDCNGDYAQAEALLDAAIEQLLAKEFTVATPQSIVNTFNSLRARGLKPRGKHVDID